jgi:hypothetical protein
VFPKLIVPEENTLKGNLAKDSQSYVSIIATNSLPFNDY